MAISRIGSASLASPIGTINGTNLTLANDASISGLTVGKGGGSVATNTAFGNSALQNNTTASNNTAVGYQAGYSLTTSTQNAFFGFQSGYSQTVNNQSAYFGAYSGQSTTGSYNTFIGDSAGYLVTTGAKNTILGKFSGNGGGLDIRTASNYIVLSDGDGNPRQVIDSSGNVGIGTSTPGRTLTVAPIPFLPGNLGGIRLINISNNTSSLFEMLYGLEAGTGIPFGSLRTGNDGNSYMTFFTGTGPTERMRIDSSGNLLVGTTTSSATNNTEGFRVIAGGVPTVQRGNSGSFVVFYNSANSAVIGSIVNNGTTSTAYNTSSDYRLKENIAPMIGALDVVSQLKPVTYKWKSNGSDGQGFIAHELQSVMPDAVTGEKDAFDADGNPKYQGIDTSFLVATLTASIQEQQALITDLTTRLVALENT